SAASCQSPPRASSYSSADAGCTRGIAPRRACSCRCCTSMGLPGAEAVHRRRSCRGVVNSLGGGGFLESREDWLVGGGDRANAVENGVAEHSVETSLDQELVQDMADLLLGHIGVGADRPDYVHHGALLVDCVRPPTVAPWRRKCSRT